MTDEKIPVEQLLLPKRAEHALLRHGYKFVEDVENCIEKEGKDGLTKLYGIGPMMATAIVLSVEQFRHPLEKKIVMDTATQE